MQVHREKRAAAHIQRELPNCEVGTAPWRIRPNEGDNGGPEEKDRTGSFAVDETIEHCPRVRQKSIMRGIGGRVFHRGYVSTIVLSVVYFHTGPSRRQLRYSRWALRSRKPLVDVEPNTYRLFYLLEWRIAVGQSYCWCWSTPG